MFMGGVMFITSMQILWTVDLNEHIERKILIYSGVVSLLLFELMVLLSFVPLAINVYALIVTTAYYSIIGMVTNYIGDRLYKTVIREYIFVLIFVIIIALLTLQW